MKVWIVTTGDYSDYSIHSVWSSEELANEAFQRLNVGGEEYYPRANEPFEVDVDTHAGKLRGEVGWEVRMSEDGSRATAGLLDFADNFKPDFNRTQPFIAPVGGFVWRGYATDKQHAIKICNEKRIQDLATRV